MYGTVLVCPSVTPHGRSNPSFRVFSMDPSSYQLLSYQQFHLNLTLANGRICRICYIYSGTPLIGERERANLVVQLAQFSLYLFLSGRCHSK